MEVWQTSNLRRLILGEEKMKMGTPVNFNGFALSGSPMRLYAPLTVRGVVVDTIPGGVNQERLRTRLC